jgi:hypothetical protein
MSPTHSWPAKACVLAFTIVFSSGCSLIQGFRAEPGFGTVAIATEGELETDLEARTTTGAVLSGGGAGAIGGAVAGATAGGAAAVGTGPLAFIFVPAGIMVGGAMGLVAGGTVGAVAGGLQGLPAEKAEEVTQILVRIAESRDFQEEFVSAVKVALPEDRQAPADSADATAVLKLTQFDLDQHMSDEISVLIEATMTFTWGPSDDRSSRGYDYEYEAPGLHVDEWLQDDGAAFSAAITEGLNTIASEAAGQLVAFESL